MFVYGVIIKEILYVCIAKQKLEVWEDNFQIIQILQCLIIKRIIFWKSLLKYVLKIIYLKFTQLIIQILLKIYINLNKNSRNGDLL